ncbi:MAG: GGDEF domain-containing protein, partial [Pseudomonadales bacterium]|nr:GGDEF domain-containing protein [Pseudomonadales bacterium]
RGRMRPDLEQQASGREKERREKMVQERTRELESTLNELSAAHETLKELNTVDAVTGIKNRQYFDNIFEQEWRRAVREKYPLSILLLDIDRFKNVNDTWGHLAGDECLREIANITGSFLKRPADILARYGGEEFVIVLPYVANENAAFLAEQIREGVESSEISADGQIVKVTISIGVCSVTPGEGDDPRDLINAADMALYEAKSDGRNLVRNAGKLTVHRSQSAG